MQSREWLRTGPALVQTSKGTNAPFDCSPAESSISNGRGRRRQGTEQAALTLRRAWPKCAGFMYGGGCVKILGDKNCTGRHLHGVYGGKEHDEGEDKGCA
jgi:hypothetical protein